MTRSGWHRRRVVRLAVLCRVLGGVLGGALIAPALCETMRLHHEGGWEVPGLAQIAGKAPSQRGSVDFGGTKVVYESFTMARGRSYRVMFLSHADKTEFVTWLSIAPRTVSLYRVGRRVIGVIVEGVVRLDANSKTGAGGSGGEVRIAYQDVDGSGRMKLALQNLPADFRLEVPEWAKK